MATQEFQLSFSDGIALVEGADGSVALQRSTQPIVYRQATAGWRAALRQLAAGGASERELGALVLEADGHSALMQFYPRLQRLIQSGALRHTLLVEGRPFATLAPFVGGQRFQEGAPPEGQRYQLSRFAYTHSEGGRTVLDSPLAHASLILHDARASALLALLARPQTAADLAGAGLGLDLTQAALFLSLLINVQAVVGLDPEGGNPEATSPTLGQWEFHDLLFHSQSRFGRHRGPYGGAYASKGVFAPLPAVKPIVTDEVIALERPELARLAESDPPLTAVVERRRSIRAHGERPISRAQLGEFLYRVARVKKVVPPDADGLAVNFRPYPAGGALYELEIYPVISRCAGVDPGLYYYHPLHHQLCKVAGRTPLVDEVLTMAATTATMTEHPQVFLAITARFQRVQWKYQAVAYALMLKHVGVLYQSMYLAATAMGLAPCGLGGGNADLFAAAAGLDYYAETTVGDFILGTNGEQRA